MQYILPEKRAAGGRVPGEKCRARVPYRLAEKIVALSVAETWDEARSEWALEQVFLTAMPGTCLCGHYPILEHCILRNRKNGNEAVVGNVCVTRFLGLPADRLFAALNRVAKDRGQPLNAEMIAHAYRRGWINEWERSFCLDTCRKRSLSPRQRAKRKEINERVLALATGVCDAD